MNKNNFLKTSLYFVSIVTIIVWSLLIWQHYYHGGVPNPHILHREDLPAISNWWSGLLLPLLSWFLLYRIQKRLLRDTDENSKLKELPTTIFYGFAWSLFFGILLSVLFTFGHSDIIGYIVIGLLLLGLFFPIYRAEYLLGFVIGMTFTFGAVLPTAFGSILALISSILYYVRAVVSRIFKKSQNR